MSLLPKSKEDFSQKDYWNDFFKKRGTKAFEWYGEYPELCGLLHKYAKYKDVILMIGCGNSTLSADLYDVGYRNITNIDISHVVINQMQNSHGKERPEMVYRQMDALNMSFTDGQFSAVIDKGTLDALMTDEACETINKIDKLFHEIDRVLRVGGRYVCISLLQEHIIVKLLQFFSDAGWMIRVCRCVEAEEKSRAEGSSGYPVFVVICTKFKKIANTQVVFEVSLAGDHIQRVDSAADVISAVKSMQQTAMVCSRLHRGNVAGYGEVFLDLYRPNMDTPRFTVHVLDQQYAKECGRRFAAFIVPQGRESEWVFATPEGRCTLLKSAGFDRLAIVSLHRDHTYTDLDAVQNELTDSITYLMPAGMTKNQKIPYLSVGADVGHREVCFQGHSELSGDFVVEEVEGEEQKLVRRLIFLSNPSVIQSEARLKLLKSRKGKPKKMVDTGYLSCEHHTYMTVGVSLATPEGAESNVAVIGLGGGGLCSFIHHCFPKVKVTAVDIDPTMLEVAVEYFDLVQDDRLSVYIRDGIRFLHQAVEKGTHFHAILFDVDCKNPGLGMSCPPKEFLDSTTLKAVKKCIGNTGLFVLNLVCRNTELRDVAITSLKYTFASVCSYKLTQELNEVVFCWEHQINKSSTWQVCIEEAANKVNALARKRKLIDRDLIDVTNMVSSLQMISQ